MNNTIFQTMLERGHVKGLPMFQIAVPSVEAIDTYDAGELPNGTILHFVVDGGGVVVKRFNGLTNVLDDYGAAADEIIGAAGTKLKVVADGEFCFYGDLGNALYVVAKRNPDVNDDLTKGVSVNPATLWINTTSSQSYYCSVASEGNASWLMGGLVPEAPVDSNVYARSGNSWYVVKPTAMLGAWAMADFVRPYLKNYTIQALQSLASLSFDNLHATEIPFDSTELNSLPDGIETFYDDGVQGYNANTMLTEYNNWDNIAGMYSAPDIFPATLRHVVLEYSHLIGYGTVGLTSGTRTKFSAFLLMLVNQPAFTTYRNDAARTLNAGSSEWGSTSLLTPDELNAYNSLVNAGWTITTPNGNMPLVGQFTSPLSMYAELPTNIGGTYFYTDGNNVYFLDGVEWISLGVVNFFPAYLDASYLAANAYFSYIDGLTAVHYF